MGSVLQIRNSQTSLPEEHSHSSTKMTEDIVVCNAGGIRMNELQAEYLLWLQNLRDATGGNFDTFFRLLAVLSGEWYLMLPGLIIYWIADRRKGAIILSSFAGTVFLCTILQYAFGTPLPEHSIPLLEPMISIPAGYAFPCHHAAGAAAFFGGLTAAYRHHLGLCSFFGFMIILTTMSGGYAGYCTPSAGTSGILLGLAFAILVLNLSKTVISNKNADIFITLLAAVPCIAATAAVCSIETQSASDEVSAARTCITSGMFFGTVLGWLVERRLIRCRINGSRGDRSLCALIGTLLYVILMTSFCDPACSRFGTGIATFCLCAAVPFAFMTVYPAAVKLLWAPRGGRDDDM